MEEDCKDNVELTEAKFTIQPPYMSPQSCGESKTRAECREEIEFVSVNKFIPVLKEEVDNSDELEDNYSKGVSSLHPLEEDVDIKVEGPNNTMKPYTLSTENSSTVTEKTLPRVLQYFGRNFDKGKKYKIVYTKALPTKNSFFCSHCNYMCLEKKQLMRHEKIHTQGKPFVCSHCDGSFTHKYTLIMHMRTHTGEKPFICSHCDISFTRKSYLLAHIRIHTGEKPFVCPHCDNSFTHNANLVGHLRRHTGERPFLCSQCKQRFARKSTLDMHMKTHTGEKPFVCTCCNKSFTRKSSMTRHMRVYKGNNPKVA